MFLKKFKKLLPPGSGASKEEKEALKTIFDEEYEKLIKLGKVIEDIRIEEEEDEIKVISKCFGQNQYN